MSRATCLGLRGFLCFVLIAASTAFSRATVVPITPASATRSDSCERNSATPTPRLNPIAVPRRAVCAHSRLANRPGRLMRRALEAAALSLTLDVVL